jgi:hypothetical protein
MRWCGGGGADGGADTLWFEPIIEEWWSLMIRRLIFVCNKFNVREADMQAQLTFVTVQPALSFSASFIWVSSTPDSYLSAEVS